MNEVKIITDSCADLNQSQLEEYGIDYVLMSVVENGIDVPVYMTWTPREARKYYDTLRSNKKIYTAQVSSKEFETVFSKYIENGNSIIYIGCSSKLSSSVLSAKSSANALKKKYPDCEIYCIDSHNVSIGIGMLAMEAAKLAKKGKSAKEINDVILSMRRKVNQYLVLNSLSRVKRAGKVSASSVLMNSVFNIKPIIISDSSGNQVSVKKVTGKDRALGKVVQYMKESTDLDHLETIFVYHADCPKSEIDRLVALIRKSFGTVKIEIGLIGKVLGASTGAESVGIWALGK